MTRGEGGVKNWDFYGDILFEWPKRFMTKILSCRSYQGAESDWSQTKDILKEGVEEVLKTS